MFDGLYAVVMSGSLIGIFLQVVPITFLVGLVYAIYRLVKIRKRELSVSWGAEIMRWLFVCYLTGLINLVLVPRNFWTYIWFYLYNGYSGGELDPLFSGNFNLVPTFLKAQTGEFTILLANGVLLAFCFKNHKHTEHFCFCCHNTDCD